MFSIRSKFRLSNRLKRIVGANSFQELFGLEMQLIKLKKKSEGGLNEIYTERNFLKRNIRELCTLSNGVEITDGFAILETVENHSG